MVKPALGAALAFLACAPAFAQVVLNASSSAPPAHPLTAGMLVPFCADIEKVTRARVRCNILPKAPVGAVQTLDGIKDGLMDLSFITHGYTPGRFALTDAAEFPFMGDTAEITSVAFQRIHERVLARTNEHGNLVLLSVFTHGPGQIYNTRRAVRTIADLEGLKIRVGGGVGNDLARNLGAVPMLKSATESYELLSSGIADGVFFPKDSPMSFKLVPLIRHVTYVPGGLYNVTFAWVANPTKWNRISAADRKLIEPLLGEALARRSGLAWDAADARGEAAVREAKIPIVIAGPQLIAEIRARAEPLEREWIEKKAKPKGVDGEAVLKALRAEIAALQKEK
ncbi:MAG: TRAP transporter substrate-binding protein [Betaproteobacteria bacterium]|nr:MAG: TRAP transporter substrate-binding protein [Betaproteobacteria bacterium]TMH80851.1 MAG: TRAP transporter substrate-binding protein [Betaproteobacteria bacterium]